MSGWLMSIKAQYASRHVTARCSVKRSDSFLNCGSAHALGVYWAHDGHPRTHTGQGITFHWWGRFHGSTRACELWGIYRSCRRGVSPMMIHRHAAFETGLTHIGVLSDDRRLPTPSVNRHASRVMPLAQTYLVRSVCADAAGMCTPSCSIGGVEMFCTCD